MSPASPSPDQPAFNVRDYREVLLANNAVYEWLVQSARQAHQDGQTELALTRVASAADFAGRHYPGRFSDATLENIALEIGRALKGETERTDRRGPLNSSTDKRRRVLHVATRVYAIGGHTRMLRHWIENDSNSRHSLVLLDQAYEVVPQWLIDCIESTNGRLNLLNRNSSIGERALQLRSIAQRSADLVVLHHHPHDVVPTVAFANANCPPVALLNHADHVFWLGSSVSDVVVDLRSVATSVSTERRGARRNAVLPIPIAESASPPSRAEARATLGIPDDQLVLLSVGRGEKYRPCGPYDFVGTATQLLHTMPGAHLYVVGASPNELIPYVRSPLHPRVHLVGNVEDPTNYRCAADIYLESFPFGSNTALLEAAQCSLPVVAAYGALFPLLVAANDSLDDVLISPRDEQQFKQQVQALVAQPALRKEQGSVLRGRVTDNHTGEGWLRHLDSLYSITDTLNHVPTALPESSCSELDGDIGLTLRHFFSQKHGTQSHSPDGLAAAVLRYGVQVSRDAGNFRTARRLATRAVQQQPLSPAAWRLLTVAALGRGARFVVALVQLRWSAESLGLKKHR